MEKRSKTIVEVHESLSQKYEDGLNKEDIKYLKEREEAGDRGSTGKLAEINAGLSHSSRLKDAVDGELKTFKVKYQPRLYPDYDLTPGELVTTTTVSSPTAFVKMLEGESYEDSALGEKLEKVCFAPFHRDKVEKLPIEDWHYCKPFMLDSENPEDARFYDLLKESYEKDMARFREKARRYERGEIGEEEMSISKKGTRYLLSRADRNSPDSAFYWKKHGESEDKPLVYKGICLLHGPMTAQLKKQFMFDLMMAKGALEKKSVEEDGQ